MLDDLVADDLVRNARQGDEREDDDDRDHHHQLEQGKAAAAQRQGRDGSERAAAKHGRDGLLVVEGRTAKQAILGGNPTGLECRRAH